MNHLKYDCGNGQYKNWIVEESKFDVRFLGKCEAIFCQGNGYLGLRNALEERYVGEQRNMFVTGTFNKIDDEEVPELPNIPDITNTDIYVNGYRFSLENGNINKYRRYMNYKSGESVREVEWTCPTGEILNFKFKRFVSLNREHVIGNAIEIEALTGNVELLVESGIDGKMTNTGVQHFNNGKSRIYDGTYIQMVSTTTQSKVTAVIQVANSLWMNGEAYIEKPIPYIRNRRNVNTYTISLQKGSSLLLEKMSTVHTTRDKKYTDLKSANIVEVVKADAMEELKEVHQLGYDKILKESIAAWEDFWNNHDVKVETNNVFDQIAIRFAIYHLHIMNKPDDNRVGIGAKGLSGEEYKGHSFWDTEIFLMPYYIFTNPKAARTLLEYRYHILKGAHDKAEKAGYKGAMYPWESAWIDDGEVTAEFIGADIVTGKPMKVLTGEIEVHISADVAYAIWEYYTATKDQDFMDQYGYEMIIDTARFWASRVEWNSENECYDINDVIGPDEYKEHVDNNAYTNYMAHYNMKLALEIMEQLPKETYDKLNKRLDLAQIKDEVTEVIRKLYLPKPRKEDDIIAQNASFLSLKEIDLSKYKNSDVAGSIYKDYNVEQLNGIQLSKQGDLVVLLYLLGDLFDEDIKRKNYLYYEKHTLHDSSLSKCTHSILANDFGLEEEAYYLFQGAAATDVGLNMKSCNNGIHSACCGGIWQCAVMGFGGVRVVNNELKINPKLPKEWNSLEFKIWWQGEMVDVKVTHEEVNIQKIGE